MGQPHEGDVRDRLFVVVAEEGAWMFSIDQYPLDDETCQAAMRHFGATLLDELGGRLNKHWLVNVGGERLVLCAYWPEPLGDIAYELAVLRSLCDAGWPVPTPVAEPLRLEGRTWCLFAWLPGAPRSGDDTPQEARMRGRLLAQLHATTAGLTGMGQRDGFTLSDAVVHDPELTAALREYERIVPNEGHILRWHLDWVQGAFASIPIDNAETVILHSDFTRWNLLFAGDRLTGVLDFESTHRNYRVADFALSWRGKHDAIIAGYEEVRPLTELDWELLIPAYWSWLFMGIKPVLGAMLAGKIAPNNFAWQVGHLLRTPGLLGQRVPQYPGRSSI